MSEKRTRTPWEPPSHLNQNESQSTFNSASQPPTPRAVIEVDDEELPPAYSTHEQSTAASTRSPAAPLASSSSSAPPNSSQQRLSVSSATTVTPALRYPAPAGVPNLQWNAYVPPNSTVSSDLTTTTIVDANLSKSPQALARFLADQVLLPPIPEIRIKGTSRGYATAQDFDIRLNLLRYFTLNGGNAGRKTTWDSTKKAKRKKKREDNVEAWAKDFVSDSGDKTLIITRRLVNWDTEYLNGRLLGLLQSLNYKGRVEITFPSNHYQTILKPEQSFGSTLRSVFLGAGETYSLDIDWPYASHIAGDDEDHHSDEAADGLPAIGRVRRKCLVRTEQGWFKEWRSTIRLAILERRRGWIGEADWIETMMRGQVAETVPYAWGER
jgi:hypothetical protein